MTDAIVTPHEVIEAVKPGHTLRWDPPQLMVLARRWTCSGCGDAVVFDGVAVSGTAVERSCDEARVAWTWLEGAR